jgi:Tfp pilus assembly protein PilZ
LGANLALGLRDLSEAGVCLLLAEALPAGQEVEVHLESIQHHRPIKIPGKVVWVMPEEGGRFLAGVHFDRLLPYKDLLALAQFG